MTLRPQAKCCTSPKRQLQLHEIMRSDPLLASPPPTIIAIFGNTSAQAPGAPRLIISTLCHAPNEDVFVICFVEETGLAPLPHNSMIAMWYAIFTSDSSQGVATPCEALQQPPSPNPGGTSLETASMAFEIFTTYKHPSPGPISFQTQLTLFSMVACPTLNSLNCPLSFCQAFLQEVPKLKTPSYPSSQLLHDLQNPFPESPPPGSLP